MRGPFTTFDDQFVFISINVFNTSEALDMSFLNPTTISSAMALLL